MPIDLKSTFPILIYCSCTTYMWTVHWNGKWQQETQETHLIARKCTIIHSWNNMTQSMVRKFIGFPKLNLHKRSSIIFLGIVLQDWTIAVTLLKEATLLFASQMKAYASSIKSKFVEGLLACSGKGELVVEALTTASQLLFVMKQVVLFSSLTSLEWWPKICFEKTYCSEKLRQYDPDDMSISHFAHFCRERFSNELTIY